MINVKDLNFTYTGTTEPAIKNISFAVQPGEIFGFLGPSGAGKSTTQKILFRLLQGYHGSVQVFGRDLHEWGYDYYEQVGVSFEMPNHYTKLTALENLRYFGALYQGPVLKPEMLLELVGLKDDGDLLVSQFSKGMKNRLSVARSLVNDPKLLFMDEPTAGLDPVNARKIKDLIKAQKDAGKTVFLTTHDMTIADELCDRVAFIFDGLSWRGLASGPRNGSGAASFVDPSPRQRVTTLSVSQSIRSSLPSRSKSIANGWMR